MRRFAPEGVRPLSPLPGTLPLGGGRGGRAKRRERALFLAEQSDGRFFQPFPKCDCPVPVLSTYPIPDSNLR
jgi:hypothetical protein